jgi:hypothetical protein
MIAVSGKITLDFFTTVSDLNLNSRGILDRGNFITREREKKAGRK